MFFFTCVLRQAGKATYSINMRDRRKRKRVFHVNMLWKFFQVLSSQVAGWTEDIEVDVQEKIPVWKEPGQDMLSAEDIRLGEQLTTKQSGVLRALLCEFSMVVSNKPGRNSLTEHNIEMGMGRPVKLPPYLIPHAYRGAVQKEIEEMVEAEIIDPLMSEWSSPIFQ